MENIQVRLGSVSEKDTGECREILTLEEGMKLFLEGVAWKLSFDLNDIRWRFVRSDFGTRLTKSSAEGLFYEV